MSEEALADGLQQLDIDAPAQNSLGTVAQI